MIRVPQLNAVFGRDDAGTALGADGPPIEGKANVLSRTGR